MGPSFASSGLLDVARRTYSETIEDIQQLIKELGEIHCLPLRAHYTVGRGWHVVISAEKKASKSKKAGKLDDVVLPTEFVQVTNTKHAISCSTVELVSGRSLIPLMRWLALPVRDSLRFRTLLQMRRIPGNQAGSSPGV